MQRDKKVNDAVWKKPQKEEKTNQNEKENDGVLKQILSDWNSSKKNDKGKTEQCCITWILL